MGVKEKIDMLYKICTIPGIKIKDPGHYSTGKVCSRKHTRFKMRTSGFKSSSFIFKLSGSR